jgi:hypothetical protein
LSSYHGFPIGGNRRFLHSFLAKLNGTTEIFDLSEDITKKADCTCGSSRRYVMVGMKETGTSSGWLLQDGYSRRAEKPRLPAAGQLPRNR